MPPTRFLSQRTVCSSTRTSASRMRTRILDYLHELGISRYLLVADSRQPQRKRAWIRRHRSYPHQSRTGYAKRNSQNLQTELQNRGHGTAARHRAQSHGGERRKIPGGWMFSKTARSRRLPAYFDIEWHPQVPQSRWQNSSSGAGAAVRRSSGLRRNQAGTFRTAASSSNISIRYFRWLPGPITGFSNRRSDRLKELMGEEAPAYHEYSGILASVSRAIADESAVSRKCRRSAIAI